jgi:AAA family ATP:ADP antiporter
MSRERPPRAWAPAIVLFLIMVAHALLETARDALFLTRLGADKLGWAYVAIAVTALAAVTAVRKWNRSHDAYRMLVVFLIFGVVGTAVLAVVMVQSPWASFVLYVWTGLVASLVVPTFWLVLDNELRVTEAKRVVAWVAAGGSLGALVGSAIASVLGQLVVARHLVTAGAIGFALAAISVGPLLTARRTPRSAVEPVVEDVTPPPGRMRRYAALLVCFAIISTVTLTIGDLMFKRVMSERIPHEDIATVLGATYTGLNVLALVIQLAITPRLLDRLGVGSALAVLPLIVLATSLGFVLTGAAVAVFALKLADGGLRNSIHRVTTELLYLPMQNLERTHAKPLVEVIGQRGGQAIAAVLVLTLATGENATWTLAVMTTAAVGIWLGMVVMTRRAYLRRFRDTLDAAGIHREVRVPVLDEEAVGLLTATLSSPDERQSIAALGLLAEQGVRIPALVLYHPSIAVVRHALSLLEGDVRDDVALILQQLVDHDDPEIKAAALAASSRTGRNAARLTAALDDEAPEIRAAAAIGLSLMRKAPRDVQTHIEALRDGTTADRIALAHAIARMPNPMFRPLLLQLLSRKEPPVIRQVLRAWRAAPALVDMDRLLALLQMPRVRGEARAVFVAGGEPYLRRLIEALDDPRTPLAVRRHLPRTISRFRTEEAAAALVARLPREPDGATEFKILRALGRMRTDEPLLAIDPAPVRAYAQHSTEDATRYAWLIEGLDLHRAPSPRLPGYGLLRELLSEKRQHAIERVFRAHGITHPRENLRSIHDAMVRGDDAQRDAAREILEHVLSQEDRDPLIDLLVHGEKHPHDEAEIREKYPNYNEVLTTLLADHSDSLRCVAAHHVAERKLVELRDELMRLKPLTESKLVTQAFEQAIARLDVSH